jgi:hypothetical protein
MIAAAVRPSAQTLEAAFTRRSTKASSRLAPAASSPSVNLMPRTATLYDYEAERVTTATSGKPANMPLLDHFDKEAAMMGQRYGVATVSDKCYNFVRHR